jgi:hypothetical protein
MKTFRNLLSNCAAMEVPFRRHFRLTRKRMSRNEHHLYNAPEPPTKQKMTAMQALHPVKTADVQHL